MRLTRRALLRTLLATPLAATLDWERLLWVPRAQITVPALRTLSAAEVAAVTCEEKYMQAFCDHLAAQIRTERRIIPRAWEVAQTEYMEEWIL